MELDLQYSKDKSHSDCYAANCQEKNKTKQKELHEDSLKESLLRNLRQEDFTHLDVGVISKPEICEDDSDCISAKSCCGDSTQKTTQRRTTLRELLQLPEDCGSPSGVMSQSQIFKHSEHQEQKQVEKQEFVSKQYKWWGLLKTKGLSCSSFKADDRENKEPQRKNGNCVFGKVTNSAERTELLKASEHIG